MPIKDSLYQTLFDLSPSWTDLWRGMPEFSQKDLEPYKSVVVHFQDKHDQAAFSKLIGQKVLPNTRSLWYPEAEIGRYADKVFKSDTPLNPRYPVYVISKGRWKSRRTSRSLERIGVPYRIVIEPQEFTGYASVIDRKKLLVLPFSNLGQGSIPARNWVWEHALEEGHERHWILDDNIAGFYRLHNNLKTPIGDGTCFRIAEKFVDRYQNVALSGFNYFMFASRKCVLPPLYLNTRIYSCILIKNDIPYRWRGRYNEDTDLSLRALKDGWATVLFNAFLCGKEQTMTRKGGNTDELYKGNGRLKMAQSLQEQHPDVVVVTEKWGRPQHHVNYKPFRSNPLKLKPGVVVADGADNYGMELELLERNGQAKRDSA
jgi:hypothetical protein